MAGIIDRSNPWLTEDKTASRPEAPRTVNHRARRRALDRQNAQRIALQSARLVLERAEPLARAIAVPPAESAKLAVTRARIAAALFEVASLEATIYAATSGGGDPAILAAISGLAEQLEGFAAEAGKMADRR